jgi:hypothetical protein
LTENHAEDAITKENFRAAIENAAFYIAILPPALPFLTLYGQVFAAMLMTINPDALWLRAYIHVDEVSDDCRTLYPDCYEEPAGCKVFTFDGVPNYTLVTDRGTVVTGGHAGNALGVVDDKNDGDAIILAFEFERGDCDATGLTAWVYINWGDAYNRTLQWWLYDVEHPEAPQASGSLEAAIPPAAWTEVTIPFGIGAITATEYQLRFRTGAEGQNGTFRIDDIALTE